MRSISTAMLNHLDQRTTSLVYCWKITLFDGSVLAFTNAQKSLSIGGTLYRHEEGVSKTAITFNEGLAPDNIDLSGVIGEIQVLQHALVSGRFDHAQVEIFMVNYADLSMGIIPLSTYNIGEVRMQRGKYKFSVRGKSEQYKQVHGRTYTNSCTLQYGSSECAATDKISVNGTVTTVTNARFFSDSNLLQGNDFFNHGVLQFTGGANNGVQMRVKDFVVGGHFELALPMLNPISVNDTFTVSNGCGKLLSHCRDDHNNVINYRGFDHVPGQDKVFRRV